LSLKACDVEPLRACHVEGISHQAFMMQKEVSPGSCSDLQLQGVKVVMSNPCKGKTSWLLLSSHPAKVSDIFFKCSIFSTATSSPRLLLRKHKNLATTKHGLSNTPYLHENTSHA